MINAPAEHLSFGAIAAFIESKSDLKDYPDAQQHLKRCTRCQDHYNYFVSLMNHPPKIDDEMMKRMLQDCDCTESDALLKKNAALFLAFMTREFPERYSRQLFNHINNCFPCLLSFMKQWNDYLFVKN
ncbi:MAG: hypothetical protein ACE5HO_08260 [bacterium]